MRKKPVHWRVKYSPLSCTFIPRLEVVFYCLFKEGNRLNIVKFSVLSIKTQSNFFLSISVAVPIFSAIALPESNIWLVMDKANNSSIEVETPDIDYSDQNEDEFMKRRKSFVEIQRRVSIIKVPNIEKTKASAKEKIKEQSRESNLREMISLIREHWSLDG